MLGVNVSAEACADKGANSSLETGLGPHAAAYFPGRKQSAAHSLHSWQCRTGSSARPHLQQQTLVEVQLMQISSHVSLLLCLRPLLLLKLRQGRRWRTCWLAWVSAFVMPWINIEQRSTESATLFTRLVCGIAGDAKVCVAGGHNLAPCDAKMAPKRRQHSRNKASCLSRAQLR